MARRKGMVSGSENALRARGCGHNKKQGITQMPAETKLFFNPNNVLELDRGRSIMKIGKHKGEFLTEVVDEDPRYIKWMLEEFNMPSDVRGVIEKEMDDAGKEY
jgi:hypothetical protein